MIKDKLKEWLYLLYYFIKFLLIIEPGKLISSIFLGVVGLFKTFFSIFSKAEEKRQYDNMLVFLILIIVGYYILYHRIGWWMIALILVILFFKVKKDGKYKHDYRRRFGYKKF